MSSSMRPSNTGAIATSLLHVLDEAGTVFPPLKAVAGSALKIVTFVQDYKSDQKAWVRFAEHMEKNIAVIAQSIADQRVDAATLPKGLEELDRVLVRMRMDIEQKQQKGALNRVLAFVKDHKRLEKACKDFDRAVQLFQLDFSIQINQDIAKIVQDIQNHTENLQSITKGMGELKIGLQSSMHIAMLMKLPYAEGATWNFAQMCYPDTRVSILDEIVQWLGNFKHNGSQRIFCLTGAPGAGKTAIAHSISKLCDDRNWLATAYFFNREDTTRATKFVSTIICDLAARFPSFQASISHAINRNPSLASAGPARQFSGLITPFASSLAHNRPTVIVVDALDEGITKEIMGVLLKEVCNLPRNILFFMTTREIEAVKLLLNIRKSADLCGNVSLF